MIFCIYNKIVRITFDPKKSKANALERELAFSLAAKFDFETAWYLVDDRRDYGETRIRALGLIENRVHVMVFTETATGIRVISLRKANPREVRRYEEETA